MSWTKLALRMLLGLLTAQSTAFFLGGLRTTVKQWLIFNACAPANLTLFAGELLQLVLGTRTFVHAAILPMTFFGGLGLFVFPWKGFAIIPQISHLVMMGNVVQIILETAQLEAYAEGFFGLLAGIGLWVPLIYLNQRYVSSRPEETEDILLHPEKRMKRIQEAKDS